MQKIIEYPDELTHYGRLGMKWGQHIFGKQGISSRKLKRIKKRNKKVIEENNSLALKRNKEIRKRQEDIIKDLGDLSQYTTANGTKLSEKGIRTFYDSNELYPFFLNEKGRAYSAAIKGKYVERVNARLEEVMKKQKVVDLIQSSKTLYDGEDYVGAFKAGDKAAAYLKSTKPKNDEVFYIPSESKPVMVPETYGELYVRAVLNELEYELVGK